jgi:ribosomal protein S18 acetylase RimI-like enzyme
LRKLHKRGREYRPGYFMPALDDLSVAQLSAIERLPRREGIHILRDRELNTVITQEDGFPLAAMWSSWRDGRFTFDIVVYSTARRLGLAKDLVRIAIDQYNQEREAFDSPRFVVKVVNQAMRNLLEEHFGFSVAFAKGNGEWDMVPGIDASGKVVVSSLRENEGAVVSCSN